LSRSRPSGFLLGRVRPGVHPLWSGWASRWDFFCVVWNVYVRELCSETRWTPLLDVLLRAAGVRVGRDVVHDGRFADDLPDPDMITIEDGANGRGHLPGAHLRGPRAEERPGDHPTRVRRFAHNAVMLYGADVGANTRVGPHSVIMKHERLLAGTAYEGFRFGASPRSSSHDHDFEWRIGRARLPSRRRPATDSLDFARSLAILGMLGSHLVGTEGGATLLERSLTGFFAANRTCHRALFLRGGRGVVEHPGRAGRNYAALPQLFPASRAGAWSVRCVLPRSVLVDRDPGAVRADDGACPRRTRRPHSHIAIALLAVFGSPRSVSSLVAPYAATDWFENGLHAADNGVAGSRCATCW
jgi:hypothetical protein